MRNYGKWIGAGAIVVASLTAVAGCADRNKNGQPDDVATQGEVDNAANNASAAASNVANVASNTVSEAGKKVGTAATELGAKATAALNTGEVKAKILANPKLNNMGKTIDVTTKGNQVILSGKVQDEAQKKLAGEIAQKNSPGYKLLNNLHVAK